MISWLLALLASSQVPYELLALVFYCGIREKFFFYFKEIASNNSCKDNVWYEVRKWRPTESRQLLKLHDEYKK